MTQETPDPTTGATEVGLIHEMVTKAIDAPLLFADGLYHAHTVNGVARLVFSQLATEPLGTPDGDRGYQSRHVVTLAIPLMQLRAVADYLSDSVASWEQAGLIPPAASDGD